MGNSESKKREFFNIFNIRTIVAIAIFLIIYFIINTIFKNIIYDTFYKVSYMGKVDDATSDMLASALGTTVAFIPFLVYYKIKNRDKNSK